MKKLAKILVPFLAMLILAGVCSLSASAETLLVAAPAGQVIFIKDGGTGDGTTDAGLTPTTGNYDTTASSPAAQKDTAFYQAVSTLKEAGGGTIVICGPLTFDITTGQSNNTSVKDVMWNITEYKPDVTITYTSVWNGVDYRETADAAIVMNETAMIILPTASVFENVNIKAGAKSRYICAGAGNPISLLAGTNFLPISEDAADDPASYVGVCGGERYRKATGSSDILVDIGNENSIGCVFGGKDNVAGENYVMTGDSNVTIKSGKVIGDVGGTAAAATGLMDGNINITIEGGIFKGTISAVGNGGLLTEDKTAVVTIKGGDFTDCFGIYDSAVGFSGNSAKYLLLDYSAVTDGVQAALIEGMNAGFSEVIKSTAVPVTSAPETTTLPAVDTTAPAETTAAPADTTEAPAETTAAPADTTAAPTDTAASKPADDSSAGFPWWIIVICAVVVVAVVVAIVIPKNKKKD